MAKKKAIKLATATAIAATAFVAAAPGQSEAATNSVDKAISNAKSKMLKAFNTYNKTARVEGKLPALSTIKKDVAAAKEAYVAAQKEISKKGGTKAKKAAYTKSLDANKKYLDRAELYLKAVTTNLKPSKEAFEKAVASGKQYNVMTTQKAYQDKIAEFEAAVKKVYGPDARNLLTAKYADSANKLANSVNDEMAVYKAYRTIEQDKLIATDLKAAYEKIESVKAQAATIAKLDSKLAKNITAAVEKNNGKFEEAVKASIKTDLKDATTEEETITFSVEAPEGAEVQVIQNTDIDVKPNANGTYTVNLKEGENNIDIRTTTYGVKTANFFKVTSNQSPVVKSVSAINAKTLEVTFNKAVDFKAEDFGVSKGTVKSNIANVTLAEDKKSAQIELTSKLTKGDYTVTVKQADKESLTGTVSVQDEKVSGLNILSDIAPLDEDSKTATVGANVTNQYGEDVTKLNASSVTVTVSGAANEGVLNPDGTLTLKGINPSTVKEGDKVTITLVHGATATTTTKTVSLSAKSVASEATVGSLYNKDGKTLNQDSVVDTDKFYLPVTVKDQYGKEITDADKANEELIITNTNPAVATFTEGNELKEVSINGKNVLALEVTKVGIAGQTTVLAISKANGKSAQATVTVNEGVKISTATLSAPTELVTAKKDVLFPLTVVDSSGNEVKTLKALKAINDKITPTGGSIVEVDGKGLFVKVEGETVIQNTPVTVVVNTSAGKVSTQTIVPKAEAVATVITGISKTVDTAVRDNEKLTIDNTDLVVEDQYGQVITDEDVLETLEFTVVAPETNFAFTATSAKADGKNTNKSFDIAPVKETNKTSDKLTFKLLKEDGNPIESSAFTKTFSIVKDADFASYNVEDIKPIYVTKAQDAETYSIPEGYDQPVVVKATSKSGNVVTLKEGTDYSVTGKDASKVKFATGSETAKQTVTITINATGEQLTKEITYSKAAAKPVKVELAADKTGASASKYDLVTKGSVATAVDADVLEEMVDIIVTDQYGVKVLADIPEEGETGIDTITFTKVSGDVAFKQNGTKTAEVTDAEKEAVVNTTINVGGEKATIQLTFSNAVTSEKN